MNTPTETAPSPKGGPRGPDRSQRLTFPGKAATFVPPSEFLFIFGVAVSLDRFYGPSFRRFFCVWRLSFFPVRATFQTAPGQRSKNKFSWFLCLAARYSLFVSISIFSEKVGFKQNKVSVKSHFTRHAAGRKVFKSGERI